MDSTWYNYVRSTVFNGLRKHMKSKYPDMFFTTEEQNGNPPKFPTLYLQEIESRKRYTFDKDMPAALNHYMRLYIYSNENSDDAMDMRAEAEDLLLQKYGYRSTQLPVTVQNGVYTAMSQVYRMVGAGDKDITG